MSCFNEIEMASYVSQQLDHDDAAAVATHLRTCQACRTLHNEMRQCTNYLAYDADEFDGIDLVPSIMEIIGKEEAARQHKQELRLNWLSTLRCWFSSNRILNALPSTAVILLALFVFGVYLEHNENALESAFQPRGSASEEPENWTAISVYRRAGNRYQLLDSNFTNQDYLAFLYTNKPNSNVRFLMIFAVDKNNNIFWYYPAYNDPELNPCSIPIESADQAIQLSDEINHPFSVGPLKIWALFSAEPLCIRQVESLFHKNTGASAFEMKQLPFSKTLQQSLIFEVQESTKTHKTF